MSVEVGTDPLFDVFTDNEERLAESIRVDGSRANTIGQVSAAITAGFLLYTLYMRRRLREEAALRERPMTTHTLYELNSKIFENAWARIVWTLVPALTQGYYLGLQEVAQGNYSRGWIPLAAEDYAGKLADSLHETSSEALVQGVQAQINRRVTQRKAIDNVIDSFGVAPRTMNALVNVWSAEPERMLTAAAERPTLKNRADSMVALAIKERAKNVGQTETYAVKNNAKSIVWLYLQQEGQLPKDATKMWVTADDERTCPVCAPLHEVQVPLDAKFQTAQGEVWAPSLHPRCRCNIVLRGAVQVFDTGEYLEESAPRELELAKSAWGIVSKASSGDKYDRDRTGRFATVEQRRLKPVAFKEPEPTVLPVTTPEPEELATLEQIFVRYGARLKPVELAKPPSLVSLKQVSLANPTLAQPTLQTNLKQATLKGPSLAATAKLKSRITFPSSATLNVQQPDIDLEENETWKPTREKSYGLFFHEGHTDGDHSIMLADSDTYFYPRSGEGSELNDVIANYWEEELFSELPYRYSQLPDFDYENEDEADSHYDATASIADGVGGKYVVTYEQYSDIVLDTVAGADSHDSYRMQLPHIDKNGKKTERELTSVQAAKLLHLDEEVEYLTPTVGVSNWKNVDAEEYEDGEFTNPGKWRVTGTYKDNTKSWMGRDNPMPYKIVFIEPDDLFPD